MGALCRSGRPADSALAARPDGVLADGDLRGADGWAGVALWGRAKRDGLRQFFPFPHGVVSHDTFDAMGCQKAIAAKITQQDCDYAPLIKNNQPGLAGAIEGILEPRRGSVMRASRTPAPNGSRRIMTVSRPGAAP